MLKTQEVFAERLADAIMTRRTKTPFVSEVELETLFDDCLFIWRERQGKAVRDCLNRIRGTAHYLAAAGNWPEFLELIEISDGDTAPNGGDAGCGN